MRTALIIALMRTSGLCTNLTLQNLCFAFQHYETRWSKEEAEYPLAELGEWGMPDPILIGEVGPPQAMKPMGGYPAPLEGAYYGR